MTCRTVESLIIDSEDRRLGADELRRVEEHLAVCPACRGFAAGRRAIRDDLKAALPGLPPPELVEATRRRCLEALNPLASEARPSRRLPAPIAAALGLLTVLTMTWLTMVLAGAEPDQALPPAGWAALVLIIQNALMLFFAPVVFRARRRPEDGTVAMTSAWNQEV
jgi:anti-sigma factor RsiW